MILYGRLGSPLLKIQIDICDNRLHIPYFAERARRHRGTGSVPSDDFVNIVRNLVDIRSPTSCPPSARSKLSPSILSMTIVHMTGADEPLQYFQANSGAGSSHLEVGGVFSSINCSAQLAFRLAAISSNSFDFAFLRMQAVPGRELTDSQ